MDDEQLPSGCRGVRTLSCVPGWRRAWIGCCVLDLRENVRPAGRSGLGNAKKFALLGKNGRFSVFLGLLGEFFRGLAKMRPLLGEFFRAGRRMGARRANFVAR